LLLLKTPPLYFLTTLFEVLFKIKIIQLVIPRDFDLPHQKIESGHVDKREGPVLDVPVHGSIRRDREHGTKKGTYVKIQPARWASWEAEAEAEAEENSAIVIVAGC
jgi:hypothetical protein